MNTKSATLPQVEAQDAVPETTWVEFTDEGFGYARLHVACEGVAYRRADLVGWRPMSSAPAGDVTACIDIWSGEEECRITDCFWDVDLGAWACEVFADSGEYRVIRVPGPVAWMPAPVKPEGL